MCLAILHDRQIGLEFGGFSALALLSITPSGFETAPILSLDGKTFSFGLLFGAQLIDQIDQPGFAGLVALPLHLKLLEGLSPLLLRISPSLLERGFKLGDASGGFGADLIGALRGGLGALFGGLNDGFGVGAAFLFDQQAVGEVAGGRLRGFELAAQLCDFALNFAAFGQGGIAGLFGGGDRLGRQPALLLECGFSVLHGNFPKRLQG